MKIHLKLFKSVYFQLLISIIYVLKRCPYWIVHALWSFLLYHAVIFQVLITFSTYLVNLYWQVYGDEEWSFGYCDYGSGVFSCPLRENPMYTFRESIVLGNTSCSIFTVNQILRELSREWPGNSYDLLSRNCNHFCDAFCERLDVPKLPGNAYSPFVFVK